MFTTLFTMCVSKGREFGSMGSVGRDGKWLEVFSDFIWRFKISRSQSGGSSSFIRLWQHHKLFQGRFYGRKGKNNIQYTVTIRTGGKSIGSNQLRPWIGRKRSQTICGIRQVHNRGFIHCDNVLLFAHADTRKVTANMADFGVALHQSQCKTTKGNRVIHGNGGGP